MKYILFFIILSVFIFFLVLLFSDLKGSLRSAIKSIPPDPKTPSQRKKMRKSRLKEKTDKGNQNTNSKTLRSSSKANTAFSSHKPELSSSKTKYRRKKR